MSTREDDQSIPTGADEASLNAEAQPAATLAVTPAVMKGDKAIEGLGRNLTRSPIRAT